MWCCKLQCEQTTRQLRRTGEQPLIKLGQATLSFALRVIGVSWRFVMIFRYDSAFLKHKNLAKPLISLGEMQESGLEQPTASRES
jgi:hypothetical protein